jgi:hypothetical protein
VEKTRWLEKEEPREGEREGNKNASMLWKEIQKSSWR